MKDVILGLLFFGGLIAVVSVFSSVREHIATKAEEAREARERRQR